jgi:hypothetical protein
MSRWGRTSPSWPARWRPRCRSVWPLASAPASRGAAWRQGSARQVNARPGPPRHPLCQRARVFPARQCLGAGASSGPRGTPDPLDRSRRCVTGASGGRRQRGPPLALHPALVGWDHGDQTRPVGPPRSFSETGRRKAAAPATPSSARLAHLRPPVQTAKSRATPCCALLRCAADGGWRSRRRCEQAAATGGEHEDAPGVFFRGALQKGRR